LHEHYRPQIWAQIPDIIPYVGIIAQQLRIKTHVSSGEAQLTLFVLKPTGEVLGTYIGKSTFKENFNPTYDVPPGARLNRALSEAVHPNSVRDLTRRAVEKASLAAGFPAFDVSLADILALRPPVEGVGRESC
jgi:hypothetical protein